MTNENKLWNPRTELELNRVGAEARNASIFAASAFKRRPHQGATLQDRRQWYREEVRTIEYLGDP